MRIWYLRKGLKDLKQWVMNISGATASQTELHLRRSLRQEWSWLVLGRGGCQCGCAEWVQLRGDGGEGNCYGDHTTWDLVKPWKDFRFSSECKESHHRISSREGTLAFDWHFVYSCYSNKYLFFFFVFLFKFQLVNSVIGAPGWLSWLSVQLLISAQVMISWFLRSSPMLSFVLTAWSLFGILSLSPFISVPPSLSLSLSLSLSDTINKLKKIHTV